MEFRELDEIVDERGGRVLDRALAILWLASRKGTEGMSAKEIVAILEQECGYPKQNASRLQAQLQADRRTAKHGKQAFRLRPDALRELEKAFGSLVAAPKKKVQGPGTLVPREIVEASGRGYLLRVVDQVNGAFDDGYYDACGVMARRLLETLIIEAYVEQGRGDDIKDAAGNFATFETLIGKVAGDGKFHLSRETKRALPEVKRVGDQCAHNPKFNARASEIEAIRHGLRVACEELIHACGYTPSTP